MNTAKLRVWIVVRSKEAAFQVTFVKVVHHRHDLRVHAELHIEACADGFVRHLEMRFEQRGRDHLLEATQVVAGQQGLRFSNLASAVFLCTGRFAFFYFIHEATSFVALLKQRRQLAVVAHQHSAARTHQGHQQFQRSGLAHLVNDGNIKTRLPGIVQRAFVFIAANGHHITARQKIRAQMLPIFFCGVVAAQIAFPIIQQRPPCLALMLLAGLTLLQDLDDLGNSFDALRQGRSRFQRQAVALRD